MKMRSAVAIVAVVVLVVTALGCTRRMGDLALVSTRTPQYERMASTPLVRNVEGKDSRAWILFIPMDGSPNAAEAVDRALDTAQGDFMVNARFYSTGWSILLFSYGANYVVGDVGNSKGANTLVVPAQKP